MMTDREVVVVIDVVEAVSSPVLYLTNLSLVNRLCALSRQEAVNVDIVKCND